MKTQCGIIQDLLPLYEDGVCSPESRAAVEEHLRECAPCRELHQRMTAVLPEQPEGEPEQADVNGDRRFRKGLKKLRRRWAVSLIAALLAVPLALMSVAQVTGEGVCFTNLGQIARGYHFLSLLKGGEYGKAFDMLELESTWQSLTQHENYGSGDVTRAENYRAITIDGQEWMLSPDAQEWYFDEIPDTLEGEAALDFWEDMFLHTQADGAFVLIPEQAYEALLTERGLSEVLTDMELPYGPSEVSTMSESGELQEPVLLWDREGNGYYMVSFYGRTVGEIDSSTYLYEVCGVFPCVPKAAWETMAEEEMRENAAFTERALQYLSMGYEEWLARSREQFIAGMEEWEAEYGRITGIRFHTAYGRGTGSFRGFSDTWHLEFDLRFAGSEIGEGGIGLSVRGGKLWISGGYCQERESIVGSFLDMVYRIKCYTIPDGAQ